MRGADRVAAVVAGLNAIYGRWTRETTVEAMRRDWDDAFGVRARNWQRQRFQIGNMDAEWISAPQAQPENAILFLHGGGFRIGSIDSHRDLAQRLSEAARARVLTIDYRLSPEHGFPSPVEDALAGFRWLLEQGMPAQRIAIAGDSAGGGLALACMIAARDAGLPMPCAAFLMSPWTDMTASGASYETCATLDPMHQRAMILGMARGYLGKDGDPRAPLASPLFADLRGLPPLIVQCGGREVILDDSRVLAERAREAGVAAELDVYEPMIHVFHMFAELPEAGIALSKAGVLLQTHFARS